MLHEFLNQHRDAIIERARARVAARRVPLPSRSELTEGVPAFLTQLAELLREEVQPSRSVFVATTPGRAHEAMGNAADQQGDDLLRAGLTVAQVVEGYGDVCQAVTEYASELKAPISLDEYHTLNLCLDVATARAVSAFSAARDRRTTTQETERLGVLAHEMRNLLSTAMLSYQALKGGGVGIDGSTGAVLGRSLRGLRDLIDRSLTEVRLAATLLDPERVVLAEFIEEMEVSAALDATAKGLALDVPAVEPGVAVNVDRPLLASAVANLVQNAIKFTPAGGRVSLTGRRNATHVLIEVEDECGGLPEGRAETMFQPFDRGGTDAGPPGLGLGLKISRDAVMANDGQIQVRNLPGRGCVFSIALAPVE
ncbi:sensor histidine kinase [Anaeromyxobacter dehalogenans]|uniref:histidine kinase n=1 Tax=Anaeromyxobacter dehalogenans (strain 2CP-C) TaxID=290397 RepID=Q2IKN3_ANADE|nr:HAMP domain-containing sensor histidine kinase [Anaeromyxobacter dehalogenans]ABC82214.1 histidine kinase [Anaeromyxobacter dehalogenans 2CP-C]